MDGMGKGSEGTVQMSATETGYRMRDNGLKLCQESFWLGIRQNFFSGGAERQWHRLPREVVESPSLEVFKNLVDVALRDMTAGQDRLS